ncbi:unnamed protein product, partial [marine sediment metagenome]
MPPHDLTQILWWLFIDGEELAMTGVGLVANLPTAQGLHGLIIEIDAVGGDLRYQINGAALATSHGFVPENGARIIGPLQNWESLGLYGARANSGL